MKAAGIVQHQDTVIKSRNIFTSSSSPPVNGYLIIRGEKIAAIIDSASLKNAEEFESEIKTLSSPGRSAIKFLDYGDLYIMPGLIDMNVHLNSCYKETWRDIARTTQQAIRGGVTTIIDSPIMNETPPGRSEAELVKMRGEAIARESYVDFGLFASLDIRTIKQIDEIIACPGVLGLKGYLSRSFQPELPYLTERDLNKLKKTLASISAKPLICLHPEMATDRDFFISSPLRSEPIEKRLDLACDIQDMSKFGGGVHGDMEEDSDSDKSMTKEEEEAVDEMIENLFAEEREESGRKEFALPRKMLKVKAIAMAKREEEKAISTMELMGYHKQAEEEPKKDRKLFSDNAESYWTDADISENSEESSDSTSSTSSDDEQDDRKGSMLPNQGSDKKNFVKKKIETAPALQLRGRLPIVTQPQGKLGRNPVQALPIAEKKEDFRHSFRKAMDTFKEVKAKENPVLRNESSLSSINDVIQEEKMQQINLISSKSIDTDLAKTLTSKSEEDPLKQKTVYIMPLKYEEEEEKPLYKQENIHANVNLNTPETFFKDSRNFKKLVRDTFKKITNLKKENLELSGIDPSSPVKRGESKKPSSLLLRRKCSTMGSTSPLSPSQGSPFVLNLQKLREESQKVKEQKERKNTSSYDIFLMNHYLSWESNGVKLLVKIFGRGNEKFKILLSNLSAPCLPFLAESSETFYTETCAPYLFFHSQKVKPKKTKFKCSPPIRGDENRNLLLECVKARVFDVISSYHLQVPKELKNIDDGNFRRAFNGLNGIGFSLQAVWSKLYSSEKKRNTNKKDLNENIVKVIQILIDSFSERPAHILSLGAKKGRLQPGLDADIFVWNPFKVVKVKKNDIVIKGRDTSIFKGRIFFGEIRATFLRGVPVYEYDKKLVVRRGAMLSRNVGI